MAEIIPFRALEYSRDRVPVEKVVTQPYDKITPEMEERYRALHPNNIVRVIRPASEPDTDPTRSPYQRAADLFRQWRREGIVEQAAEPFIYAYFQRFRAPGTGEVRTRKGFIALTRLEDYANRVIFPHERTLRGPKQDRLELLRQTRTHFGQVFLLYSDPARKIDAVLDEAAARPADVAVQDEYEVEHLLWRVSEARAIGAVRQGMAGKKLVIADGHHRYETALAFRDEKRKEMETDNAGAFEWLMTTLVNMESPGMAILPTHRVLSNFASYDPDRLLERVRAFFQVTEVAEPAGLERGLREGGSERPTIGLAAAGKDGLFLLGLRRDLDLGQILPDVSARQAGLDVVILHRLVLEKCLGISEAEVSGESYLRYVRGLEKAVDEVRGGRAQACFLLNATRVDQVRDIASSGEVLPQKSTDFFPKLLSGLTMYAME